MSLHWFHEKPWNAHLVSTHLAIITPSKTSWIVLKPLSALAPCGWNYCIGVVLSSDEQARSFLLPSFPLKPDGDNVAVAVQHFQRQLSNRQVTQRPWQHIWTLASWESSQFPQKSQVFEGPLAIVTLSRLWSKSSHQKSRLWRPSGHVMLSRFWLKFSPKVKLSRPAGHVTLSRFRLKRSPKVQTLKARWPCHVYPGSDQNSPTKVKLWRPSGHVTLSRFWLKAPSIDPKVANFEDLLAMSHCPSFWLKSAFQKPNFEGRLAMSRCPGSDWTAHFKSQTVEGRLAMSSCPGSDWNIVPKVKLWRPAGHVTLSRLWLKYWYPKVKLWRPAGHVTLSRFWLKSHPKVKLWRPSGHVTLSRFWLKYAENSIDSNFEGLLAMSRCPDSDWNLLQKIQ